MNHASISFLMLVMIHFQFSFLTVFMYMCVYSMWHVNSVFARLGVKTACVKRAGIRSVLLMMCHLWCNYLSTLGSLALSASHSLFVFLIYCNEMDMKCLPLHKPFYSVFCPSCSLSLSLFFCLVASLLLYCRICGVLIRQVCIVPEWGFLELCPRDCQTRAPSNIHLACKFPLTHSWLFVN